MRLQGMQCIRIQRTAVQDTVGLLAEEVLARVTPNLVSRLIGDSSRYGKGGAGSAVHESCGAKFRSSSEGPPP